MNGWRVERLDRLGGSACKNHHMTPNAVHGQHIHTSYDYVLFIGNLEVPLQLYQQLLYINFSTK
jgi:hypothetical protein